MPSYASATKGSGPDDSPEFNQPIERDELECNESCLADSRNRDIMAFEDGGSVLVRETLALHSSDRHEPRKRVLVPVFPTRCLLINMRYPVKVLRMSTEC